MEYRNAYELEDGRIHVEIYDEGFDDWAEWVVDPNDAPTKKLWKAIKDNGGYLTYEEWLKQNADAFKTKELYENALKEIRLLKLQLQATDYQAIKYAEGELSETEYAPIKEQRRAWRLRINELEKVK
jgi:hypothetical protein